MSILPFFRKIPDWLPAAGVYTVLALIYLPDLQHQCNPDGISYIAAAEKYLAGDPEQAINGHWAPMMAWLLVPLLALGIEKGLAFKLLLFAAGWAAFLPMRRLLRASVSDRAQVALLLPGLAALSVYLCALCNTPDVLSAALLLAYLNVIWSPDYLTKKKWAVWAGCLGGLGYLTKHYALPFTVVHLLVAHGMMALASPRSGRSVVLGRLALSLGALCLFCAPWTAVLSHRYGHWTLSTAGTYNNYLMAPGSKGHPGLWAELLAPPDSDSLAYSAWDDPSRIAPEGWEAGPFGWSDRVALVADHLWHRLLPMQLGPWPVPYVAASVLLLSCLWWHRHRKWSSRPLQLAAVWLLLPSGYLMLWIEPRYVWGLAYLSLLPLAWSLERLPMRWGRVMAILSSVVLWWFSVRETRQAAFEARQQYAYYVGSLSVVPLNGRSFAGEGRPYLWSTLGYYNRGRYCGFVRPDRTPEEIGELLEDPKVDVYFDPDSCDLSGFGPPSGKWSDFFVYERAGR
jgi:hypothetical protein